MSADFLLEAAGRFPLLTPELEIELGRQIRAWQDHEGGPDAAPPAVQRRGRRALDRFALSNLRLAHYVARRYTGRGVPLEDLMQASAMGLIEAYKRFDPTLGYRSSSYAVWWAQQACQVLVAQQGNGLKLPTTVSEKLRKLARVSQKLISDLGRLPSSSELEEAAGLSSGQLSDLQAARRRADVRSLHSALEGGGHSSSGRQSLMDVVEGGDNPAASIEREELQTLLHTLITSAPELTPQQRVLLQCRYLRDKPPSIARLASELHLNRETCRRLERSALQILKSLLPAEIGAYRSLL